MKRISITVLLLVATLSARTAAADSRVWCLAQGEVPESIYRTFYAEPRASLIRLGLASYDAYPLAEDSDDVFGMDLSLGTEIPLVGWSRKEFAFNEGDLRFGVYLDVSWHMLWDLDGPSDPIVNTDYRFSKLSTIRASMGLPGGFPGDRSRVAVLLSPKMHESSHIGDELTLQAERRVNPVEPFRRVDVSKDVLLWAVMYEVEKDRYSLALQVGGNQPDSKGLWNTETTVVGAYDPISGVISTTDEQISKSDNDGQFFIGGEGTILAALWNMDLMLSWDARKRPVYEYQPGVSSVELRQAWSQNIIVGMRGAARVGPYNSFVLFLRHYDGVNPAGQFRSQDDYNLWSLGLGLMD